MKYIRRIKNLEDRIRILGYEVYHLKLFGKKLAYFPLSLFRNVEDSPFGKQSGLLRLCSETRTEIYEFHNLDKEKYSNLAG